MSRYLITLIAALLAVGSLTAETTNSPQILVQLETFRLPKPAAEALLLAAPKDAELRSALRRMVLAKAATLANLMLVRAESGRRARLEQIDEFPYPTDFDPGQIPQTITLINPRGLGLPSTPAPMPLRGPLQEPQPVPASNAGFGIMSTITPTAFTTRNLGETLEVSVRADLQHQRIAIALATESVQFVGFSRKNSEDQPQIEAQKMNTGITVASGTPVFLGTLTKSYRTGTLNANTKDELTLVFLTATVDPASSEKQASSTTDTPRFQWEIISLPKDAAVLLLEEMTEDAGRLGKLRTLIKAKSARLELLQSWRGEVKASAPPSKLEALDEISYPTDFHPPSLPQSLTIADQRLLDLLHEEGGRTAPAPDAPLDPANGGFGIMTRVTPTSYALRKVGAIVALESVWKTERTTMALHLTAERPRLLTMKRYEDCQQPLFEVPKVDTTIQLGLNRPLLVSTLSPPVNTGADHGNTEERIWFAFLTAFAPTEP